MVSTLLLFGLVLGRWWRTALADGAGGRRWRPALAAGALGGPPLLITDTIAPGWTALGAAGIALINTGVGILVRPGCCGMSAARQPCAPAGSG